MEKRSKVTLILQIFMYGLLVAFAAYFLLMIWGSITRSVL